jgi:hypothetical protein
LIGGQHEQAAPLVLDNLETLLEEGDPEGNYRAGYQGYGRLIERLGEADHRSCVVLTSREKPREIEALEGLQGPVRSLRLVGLSGEAARSLLEDKDLRGPSSAWRELIATYAGNPLALKIVGQAIVDLFAGEIVPFLQSQELIFNGIRVVLRQQVARLTRLEQMLLIWLAVVREWTALESLLSLLVKRPTRARVLEALEALWRRSLIERGEGGSFTLQSVVMEYLTDTLLDQLSREIVTQTMDHLHRYALEQAQAKDYVREIQVRLLVCPLLERLRAELGSDSRIEDQCLSLLMRLRTEDGNSQDYGPANVISLLKALRSDLRGHRWTVYGVGWSPDGKWLASSGWDNTIRLWEPATMTCVYVLRDLEHPDILFNGMAWSPDGELLACPAFGHGVLLWSGLPRHFPASAQDWARTRLSLNPHFLQQTSPRAKLPDKPQTDQQIRQ